MGVQATSVGTISWLNGLSPLANLPQLSLLVAGSHLEKFLSLHFVRWPPRQN